MTTSLDLRAKRSSRFLSAAIATIALATLSGAVSALQDPAPAPAEKPQDPPKPEPKPDDHDHDHDHPESKPVGRAGQVIDPNAKLQIEFGAEKHDMGTVRQGEKREHVFQMSAGGTSPVIITQAKPTCGCTLGEVRVANDKEEMVAYKFGDPIPPGRKIEIAATLDTTNKNGQTQVRINVSTNDPVGMHQLALAANVEAFLTLTPSALMFGDLSMDSLKEGEVTIRTPVDEPVKLTIDDSQGIPKPKGMTVDLSAVNPDTEGRAAEWKLKVNVGPGLDEGPLGYRVALVSDKELPGGKLLPNGQKQMFNSGVSINGRVLGALTCTPMYFSLGLVRPGQIILRTVKLTSNDPTFELDDKVSAAIQGFEGEEFPWKESFSTNLRPVPGENAVEIELKLDGLPDKADGTFRGQVVIATGHPQKPSIPVSFSGVARAGAVSSGSNPPPGTKIVPPPTPPEKKSGGGR